MCKQVKWLKTDKTSENRWKWVKQGDNEWKWLKMDKSGKNG